MALCSLGHRELMEISYVVDMGGRCIRVFQRNVTNRIHVYQK